MLTAVWPVLLNGQLIVAAVGAIVGVVVVQAPKVNLAAVFTSRLTVLVAAVPAGVGVAVTEPL